MDRGELQVVRKGDSSFKIILVLLDTRVMHMIKRM